MSTTTRRDALSYLVGGFATLAGSLNPFCALAQTSSQNENYRDAARGSDAMVMAWMDTWQSQKQLVGRLYLSRFVEPIYFLTKPITWTPNPGQTGFEPVHVPRGFVTDFASIPRLFWTALRPDGDYAHAAIVHDYLYWNQATSKDAADSIFKLSMEDLHVPPVTVKGIHLAVQLLGKSAWKQNALLKAQGEKRVLKRFPSDATARWSDWKTRPDVFL
jgi:hypothetical protein